MSAGEVLVTTPSFGQHSPAPWAALEEAGLVARRSVGAHPLGPVDLAAQVGGAAALLVGLDTVDERVLAAGPDLRVVAKHGVGTDNIDLDAARARGVRVVNAPGTNADAVADLTLGLVLALARQIVPAHASVLAGRWDRFFGPELAGRVLGVLGLGRIGRGVARRATAFGMTVLAHDPFVDAAAVEAAGARAAGLAEVVSGADVLTLHLPPAPDGRPLLDAAALATMRPGALLVNAARGDLVDEAAVADALHHGRLGGYAADAFAVEPPDPGAALLSAPRTVFTPHVGAFTDGANAAMGTTVVGDIARILGGEDPRHAVV